MNNARVESLAGKFAAKEAIKKADNSLVNAWKDVEILKDETGKPYAKFKKKTGKSIIISISHERKYAVAMAIVYSEGENAA